MLSLYVNNKEVEINHVKFSDGSITYRIEKLPKPIRYICISVDPSTEICKVYEEISILDSAISNLVDMQDTSYKYILNIPYLPYARADRVFEKGNPSPLLNFLGRIDGCFDEVHTCDIHNLGIVNDFRLNGLQHKSQLSCFKESLPFDFKSDYDIVVAPDKGATEKAKAIAEYLGVRCVFASKKRDVSTGKILDIELPDVDFIGKKVLIPDDICDYGGTFIGLASKLKEKGAKEVDLYVTHLIAPKGLDNFEQFVDNIICYQTVGGYLNKMNVQSFNDRER